MTPPPPFNILASGLEIKQIKEKNQEEDNIFIEYTS